MKPDATMPPASSSADLRLAARLIEAAMARLDRHAETCEGCGKRTPVNAVHTATWHAVEPLPGKLRKWAEKLDTNQKEREQS